VNFVEKEHERAPSESRMKVSLVLPPRRELPQRHLVEITMRGAEH
jgi:hypothetical protein